MHQEQARHVDSRQVFMSLNKLRNLQPFTADYLNIISLSWYKLYIKHCSNQH